MSENVKITVESLDHIGKIFRKFAQEARDAMTNNENDIHCMECFVEATTWESAAAILENTKLEPKP